MRLLLFIAAFFSFLAFLKSQNPDVPLDRQVAWFPFGGTALLDISNNGSVGAVTDNLQGVCGVDGDAVYFDGQNDAIIFLGPINDAFAANDFALSFYIKPKVTTVAGTQLVMAKQQEDTCSAKPSFWVRYSPATRTLSSGMTQADGQFITVSTKLDKHQCWQHIVLQREFKRFMLYVNGELRAESNSSERIILTSPQLLRIAEPVCPTDRWYNGDLDELIVYNRTLTTDEIKKMYYRPDNIVNSDTIIYLGNSFQVSTTNSCAFNYDWTPPDNVSDPTIPNPVITPIETGWYRLDFLHNYCPNPTAYDSIFVTVIDPDTLDCTKVFVPNAFTPGSSTGRNDDFGISNPFVITDFSSFEVLDRWGGRVFTAKDQFDKWDGTFNGNPLNPGNYLFRLKYTCKGSEQVKAGTVILLR